MTEIDHTLDTRAFALLFNSDRRVWTADDLADALGVDIDTALDVLDRHHATRSFGPTGFTYHLSAADAQIITERMRTDVRVRADRGPGVGMPNDDIPPGQLLEIRHNGDGVYHARVRWPGSLDPELAQYRDRRYSGGDWWERVEDLIVGGVMCPRIDTGGPITAGVRAGTRITDGVGWRDIV